MTAPFRPGNRLTEERLNTGQMIGRLVFQAHRVSTHSTSSDTGPVYPDNAIPWEEADVDLLGGWSESANPTRYTPTVPGWYLLGGAIGFNNDTTGARRGCAWFVSGSPIQAGRIVVVTNSTVVSGSPIIPARSIAVELNGSTDYVELVAIQTSGGSLTTNTGSLRPSITISYAGPPT